MCNSIKTLGIHISNDKERMINQNCNERINKMENLTKMWTLRMQALKGKILFTNTLLIPQLVYLCTVLETPEWVINKFNSRIQDFIWEGKLAKVKHSCLINSIESEGLKLQDLN